MSDRTSEMGGLACNAVLHAVTPCALAGIITLPATPPQRLVLLFGTGPTFTAGAVGRTITAGP
jgi:hypothetical protein